MKLKNNKAFTIIELIVVIAILGILVLLAGPRMLGYVEKVESARIQHDIKVMEQEIVRMFINEDDEFDKWENNSKDFNQLIQEGKLFGKEGVVKEDLPIDEPYKVIPEKYKDKINTKLKGTFYTNNNGKVYYEDDKTTEEKPIEDDKIADLINEGFIPVATAEELNNIRNATSQTYGKGSKWEGQYEGGLDKKYVQIANIDLSDYSKEEGWAPIGNDSSRFTGSFNGNGYNITGLKINRSTTDYIGLFGYTEGAIIENVALENIDITGRDHTGGLVGLADGSSTITNSYATGSVTGGERTGGLVGEADSSTITNSYTTGSVTGIINTGGLMGRATSSTIENSYATGSVTGEEGSTGGLVGYAYRSTIENSYATGSVTGEEEETGGLVGGTYQSSVTNSYWDKETTGQSTSAGEGTGKTTEEMKIRGTYEGWDFDTIWQINEGISYPTLR